MSGQITKRCGCRDAVTDKQLGAACPKLSQRTHGIFSLVLELPVREDGTRRRFRRMGYETKTDATADMTALAALLDIADKKTDPDGRRRIADLLETVSATGEEIPDYDETKRRFATGQSLTQHMTVAEWLDLWLAGKKALRKSGAARYEVDLRCHLKPRIGHIRLDRLTVQYLDSMFEGIAETNEEILEANVMRRTAVDELKAIPWKGQENRARRKALKAAIEAMPPFRRVTNPATQKHIRDTLRAALNVAIGRGALTFNPASYVELPTVQRPKALVWTAERVEEWLRSGVRPSAVMVWTPEQAGAFLDFLADTNQRLYGVFHLITFRGLRRGEACGVRKADYARASRLMTIATQLVQDGWEVRESAPKTNAGERVISIDDYTDEILEAEALRQDVDRVEWGEAWVESGRLFTRENGEWIHPGWLSDQFEKLVELAGLPPIRLHDLRHVAASLMLAAGVDIKIVSETLGHSETRVTHDIYQSVMPKQAADAAEATAAMVPRGGVRRPAPEPDPDPAEPTVEQAAQSVLDQLVARIVDAAEHDGRPVEELARSALAHLAEGAAEAPEQDGLTTASHEGAKIIAFRPRLIGA
ncbi:site-specific integrase [Streptomyces sp. ISL-66]|uniref:site-specific integrase n=1 Tax=Streptomyces sp. ISL-66 TaxID=2819186 RepID=UPI001BEC2C5C|nr:site-specific integrase [Streptomyces sp. ISL-66]MBT2466541.1 site-specific integrase [Streptomyces sp. ISL-66]